MVLGIIQARLSSTRLPGKVLYSFGGGTVLGTLLKSLSGCRKVDELVVLTTDRPEDLAVAHEARRYGVHCARSERASASDVLGGFHISAFWHRADTIVRITADCPLLYASFVDDVVRRSKGFNGLTSTARYYPDGFDVEVFPFRLLDKAYCRARSKADREHVTRWMYRNAQVRYLNPGGGFRSVRLTLDTPEDYKKLRSLYSPGRGWRDYVSLEGGS